MTLIVGSAIFAYLLGSIPSAVWYGKIFHGIDIRQHGSGNAGATNSLRIFGKKAGIIVLIFDFLKGFLAVFLTRHFLKSDDELIPLIMGVMVILGHIYPVFAQFRGGKGVATAIGVVVAVLPMAALVCVVVFLLTVFLTKYVSLGSLLGALAFPMQVSLKLWNDVTDPYYVGLAWLFFFILAYTHRENIQRLVKGTESKFGVKK
ncbi:glycerol-3-phosphate 1-O-acyltransferase PlsY [Emticicia sp. SJ17W-69]|uniref:glycerol-3-phosphate 1-O-acyltransferase PlsY n=1 Tax=Emticicia sp. SJ17W-69 TaxID=3421657 RepID=UPI003EC114E6